MNLISAISALFLTTAMAFGLQYEMPFDKASYFGQFAVTLSPMLQILAPLLSLAVVLSAAFQYVSQFQSRASRHRRAAIEFANLRRKIERYSTKEEIHEEALHSFSRSYNTIARFSPLIPQKFWVKIKKDKDKDKEFEESTTLLARDMER